MPTEEKATTIRSDLDIVTARSLARDVAKQMGFSSVDQARIATAVSELARNIFVYAGTGQVQVRSIERNGRTGIEMEFTDQGPGISDIDTVMQDGYSTVKSMGMGLPGARRLMDDFDIHSQVGVGTTVVCRKWKR